MAEGRSVIGLIFKGLLQHMKPIQALVFMQLYQQFPARFIPGNDFFFKPIQKAICAQMNLKDSVYYLMVHKLVSEGWLEQRQAKSGGLEFRIVFEKLHRFVESEMVGIGAVPKS